MHKLLNRLLRRHFGANGPPPELLALLQEIDGALVAADDDRAMLERSMETVSQELSDRFDLIRSSLAKSKAAQEALSRTLSLLTATLEATADGILVVDLTGKVVQMNKQFAKIWRLPDDVLTSHDSSEAIGVTLLEPGEQAAIAVDDRDFHAGAAGEREFETLVLADGRVIERHSKPHQIDGVVVGRVWSFRDTTERRNLEAKLRQSQKLEAIGSLAGGVAHDFNNLLTVIRGHADFLKQSVHGSPEGVEDVDVILATVARASALTAQLLAFSRKQILRPANIDVNSVVKALQPMLRRLIGEDIRVVAALTPQDAGVVADRGQLEQAVLNLVVNARDAMPAGGRLTIRTARSRDALDPTREPPDGRAQEWVELSVSDTGSGMSASVQRRIFEPFFTTKEVGRGTGLGLATVHGIVQQSGGVISVESKEKEGTTFMVKLPHVETPRVGTPPFSAVAATGGKETILIAEDDSAVRELARRILQRHGYTILVARSGEQALRVSESFGGDIHLVLSDVVMPHGGGRALAEQIRVRRPSIRVVFMSGYTDDEIVRKNALDPSTSFLSKPFTAESLALAVRAALGLTYQS